MMIKANLGEPQSAGEQVRSRELPRDFVSLALILAWGLWALAPSLGHPMIHNWDESMHQAVVRGVYDSFFVPHIYSDPLYPVDPRHWWSAGVWLHKPIGPFWFAAAVMHLIGISPVGLRLASLLGQLAASAALFWIARKLVGRFWATVAALGFLALPFGWKLTQGLMFGDATDCALVGCVAIAMALLLHSVETNSWRWAAFAGAATGAGYLCKTTLALAPLGVAVALGFLRWLGFCRGPSARSILAIFAAFLLVAAPWNIYSAWRWPDLYKLEAQITAAHLFNREQLDVGPWKRPVDAIFNEISDTELAPIPVVLPFLAGVWLLIQAARKRDYRSVALSLWLWATWVVLSIAEYKVPAVAWGALPAVFVGFVLLARDASQNPALAAGILAACAAPRIILWLPSLAPLRAHLPHALVQTRANAGLFDGVLLVLIVASLVFAITRAWNPRWLKAVLGVLVAAAISWVLIAKTTLSRMSLANEVRLEMRVSYTRELGLALDKLLPARSVLFEALDRDPAGVFETQNLIFWSGRMTYRSNPDVETARARGYHPYLISPAAEPFAPVPGVPAHAWLRAYDLDVPGRPAAIPDGVTPLQITVGNAAIVGIASGPIDGEHDRYALFVRADGAPSELRLVIHTRRGKEEISLPPELSLRDRGKLVGAAWWILPVVGPRRANVTAFEFQAQGQSVTLSTAG